VPARIIINADDFGLDVATNSAVCSAARAGAISSTSLVAASDCPAFYDAVARVRDVPELGIGLHLTLVGEAGFPGSYAEFLAERAAGRFSDERIERLLVDQLDRVARAGIVVTHIDSHQHLHAFPGVMRVVAKVAVRYGIRAVRMPREDIMAADAPFVRKVQSHVLGASATLAARVARKAGLAFPDHFGGMAISGRLSVPALEAMIRQAPDHGVTEIICHPGADNAALERRFHWGYDWQGEFASLMSLEAKQCLAETGAKLITFRDV